MNYKINYLKSELFLLHVFYGPRNSNAQFLLRKTLKMPTTVSYKAKNTKEQDYTHLALISLPMCAVCSVLVLLIAAHRL